MAKRDKDESGIVRARINRQTIQSDRFVSLYANDTQVQTSPWDVRLVFGQITGMPIAEDQPLEVTQMGEVRMSPQHAKRVADILRQQIELYEKTVGVIPLPKD
jgi:ribosomal protein L22